MYRPLILLAVTLFAAVSSSADTPGVDRHYRSVLPDSIAELVRSDLSDSTLDRAGSWLASNGFFDSRIVRTDTGVVVTDSPRYRLVFEALDGVPSRPYSDAILDALLDSINERLVSDGYLLAEVGVESLSIDTTAKRILARIRVDSGDVVRIGAVSFSGTGIGSPTYLRRVAALGVGDRARAADIEEARRNLLRTRLFVTVEPAQLRILDSSRVEVVFDLDGGGRNSFDGIVGYAPSGANGESGEFTGSIDVNLVHVLGVGESFGIDWSRESGGTSFLDLFYDQPIFAGTPVGVRLQGRQRGEPETPSATAWSLLDGSLSLFVDRASWRIEAGLELAAQLPTVDTSFGDCSPRTLPKASSVGGIVALVYDDRDQIVSPTSGGRWQLRLTSSSRSRSAVSCESTPDSTFGRNRVSANAEYFLSPVPSIVVAGLLSSSAIFGSSIDRGELVRFGGVGTVRGYRQEVFRASTVAAGTIEGRFLLDNSSYVGLFVDAGYFDRRNVIDDAPVADRIFGFGVASQIETPAGLARIAVGLAEGRPVDEAIISIGLGARF